MSRTCILLVLLVTACDASSAIDDAGSSLDGELVDASGPPPVDAAAPARSMCAPGCETAADCGEFFECTAEGRCNYLGCTDTSCAAPFVCRPSQFPSSPPTCRTPCTTSADCSTGGGTYGPWVCGSDGFCESAGCASSADCTAENGLNAELDYDCFVQPGDPIAGCWAVCSVDADCATTTFPAPLACVDGLCVAAECNSDAECASWWNEGWRCFE